MTAHLLLYLADSLACLGRGASLRPKYLRVQHLYQKTNFRIGSARQNSNIRPPCMVCTPGRPVVRSAAPQALRGGRIKVQIRAAAARQK